MNVKGHTVTGIIYTMSRRDIIVRTIMLVARCGIFSVMVRDMARLVSRVLVFMRIRSWISLIHSDSGREDGGGTKLSEERVRGTE
jgi:hypothetical protein